MSKTFQLKIVNQERDLSLYQNHSTFHDGDSGLDLFIVEDVVIGAGETKLVDLGVQCQCQLNGNYFSYWLMPRSSICKTPLMMRNSMGLIDAGYLGNLKVPFYNTHPTESFTLQRGQRYVQLVNGDLSPISFQIVEEHRQTTRGSGGFGSTGL